MTYYLKWSLEEKSVLGLDFSNSNFNNLFWGKTFIHFQPILLEWVKVAQSCLTLCDPMDYAAHGILQARLQEWVAFPFSRGSSQHKDWTQVSCIAGRFFFVCLFNWRLITLQYCSGFCHTLTWISHGCTCVPHPEPFSYLPPHPIPKGHPSASALSTLSHASNLDW